MKDLGHVLIEVELAEAVRVLEATSVVVVDRRSGRSRTQGRVGRNELVQSAREVQGGVIST